MSDSAFGAIDPNRFICTQTKRLTLFPARNGWRYFDLALKDVRVGDAKLTNLDAELRAQVGDGGGGSADGERMKDEG